MKARWTRLCGLSDHSTAETIYGVIDAMYRRDGHHTLRHVAECLDLYMQVGCDAIEHEALEFALWMHDIVYIPGRGDNEQRSAILAGMMLKELRDSDLVKPVQKLILATRDHLPESGDEALMVDIDLSILGSGPARYDEYADHIRQEFSFATDGQYRTGRTEVLKGFLRRRSIFSTPRLRERFETQAQENLAREIEVLARG